MNDPFAMGGVEGIRKLNGQTQGLRRGHRAAEGATVQILHDEVVWPHVVQGANVRMVQRRDGTGFAIEAAAELAGRYLNRNCPVDARVASLVDGSHAAGANPRENSVRTQAVAREQSGAGTVEDAVAGLGYEGFYFADQ